MSATPPNNKNEGEASEMVPLGSSSSDVFLLPTRHEDPIEPTETTSFLGAERDDETEVDNDATPDVIYATSQYTDCGSEMPKVTSASPTPSSDDGERSTHSADSMAASPADLELEIIPKHGGAAAATENSASATEGAAVTEGAAATIYDEPLPDYRSVQELEQQETSFTTLPLADPPAYQDVVSDSGLLSFSIADIEPSARPPPEQDVERDTSSPRPGSSKRRRTQIIVTISVVGSLLLFFIVFFPFQFSYVPYHQWALVRSRSTGRVFTERVYESGCYVLGVDREFVYLDRHVQLIQFDYLDVFTRDNVALAIKYNIFYRVTQQGAALLYKNYALGYHDIIVTACESTIRNVGSRLNHTTYLTEMQNVTELIQRELNDKFDDWGIDISYTNLLKVYLPETTLELKLRKILTKIETEKEYALRNASLVNLETRRQVQAVNMQALETLNNATYEAETTRILANVSKSSHLDLTTAQSFKVMSDKLSLDREELRLSYLYLTTLRSKVNYRGAIGYSELMNLVTQGIW